MEQNRKLPSLSPTVLPTHSSALVALPHNSPTSVSPADLFHESVSKSLCLKKGEKGSRKQGDYSVISAGCN